MAKDDKIRLPQGQGGLTRFYDESTSKLSMSPNAVIIIAIVIGIIIALLHIFGSALLV